MNTWAQVQAQQKGILQFTHMCVFLHTHRCYKAIHSSIVLHQTTPPHTCCRVDWLSKLRLIVVRRVVCAHSWMIVYYYLLLLQYQGLVRLLCK